MKFAVEDPSDQILTVLSRHADANVLVSSTRQSQAIDYKNFRGGKPTFRVDCEEHDLLFSVSLRVLVIRGGLNVPAECHHPWSLRNRTCSLPGPLSYVVSKTRLVSPNQGITYIMRVSLESLLALPAHLPIPQLDRHIVTGRQYERLSRVDTDRSDVIGMRLEACDLF